jgi:uracil-DNA glycosylase
VSAACDEPGVAAKQAALQDAHAEGQARSPSNQPRVPATDDEIREKYLERAIRELNTLAHQVQECDQCPRGEFMPVLGSGHPQADIFLIKHSAVPSEVEEGVAFYGRSGSALMKSLKRLSIDPLAVYGTLCVKCPVIDPVMADPACVARLTDELMIVSPKIVVVMGSDALSVVNDLDLPLRRDVAAVAGELQRLTPSSEALFVPNIDESLDDEAAKREFWAAFRVLGQWWTDLPPY